MPGKEPLKKAYSQTATESVEPMINQRLNAQAKLSGYLPIGNQQPPMQPMFNLNPSMPDAPGMMNLLKQSGFTGQRMQDIPLQEDPQTLAQLKARIDALMRSSIPDLYGQALAKSKEGMPLTPEEQAEMNRQAQMMKRMRGY